MSIIIRWIDPTSSIISLNIPPLLCCPALPGIHVGVRSYGTTNTSRGFLLSIGPDRQWVDGLPCLAELGQPKQPVSSAGPRPPTRNTANYPLPPHPGTSLAPRNEKVISVISPLGLAPQLSDVPFSTLAHHLHHSTQPFLQLPDHLTSPNRQSFLYDDRPLPSHPSSAISVRCDAALDQTRPLCWRHRGTKGDNRKLRENTVGNLTPFFWMSRP